MIPLTNAEKRKRLNRLSEEEYLRFGYIPFCIAAGAWDYADTVLNIAAQMQLTETKKLCRTIRELKRSYDGTRRQHARTSSGHELNNFQVVEDMSEKSFAYMYACIKDSIQKQYPDLDGGYRHLLTAVYACLTILKVLYKYVDMQAKHVCEVCGFGSIGSILPDELNKLRCLMPEFVGDKPVKVKGLGLFVHNITKRLCKTELTDDEAQANMK